MNQCKCTMFRVPCLNCPKVAKHLAFQSFVSYRAFLSFKISCSSSCLFLYI